MPLDIVFLRPKLASTKALLLKHYDHRQGVIANRVYVNVLCVGLNSVQTRCIVKGEAQKSPLFWRFSGGF